ncbi:MAG: aminotransferase class I/II-fold pyridoxal phosphate-dependent enzyme [Oscillospiraceae bacterium]|nr:aminotransferase class I/II-fold pyridoxal phosphate-dependent enzyme [Oscillospiraceae bacterium]
MYKLPQKLKDFTPYIPLTGDYPIRLDANESFIELPTEKILQSVINVEEKGGSGELKLNRYPDPYATETINAFVELFKETGVKHRHVTAGNGSDELLGLIAAGLLTKGDKVLTFAYDFSMYGFYSKLHELNVIEMQKEADFSITPEKVIAFIKASGVRCLFFSNPCNPTSLGLEKWKVLDIIAECPDTLMVLDEAYMDFWTDELGTERHSLLDKIDEYKNLIVLRTCSKSVALAGIRLGFAVANQEITNALRMVKSPFNVNSITQSIGTAILSDKSGYKKGIEVLKTNTAWLFEELQNLCLFECVYEPKANFVFCKTPNATMIYEYLLEGGIAIRNFGEYLRICVGSNDEMDSLIRRLGLFSAKGK